MNVMAAARSKTGGEAGAERYETYTIGDLAREFGVTLRALRFYEGRGLLSPRREGTSRIYNARDRARLAVILKGKQLGFTLAEIRATLARDAKGAATPSELRLTLDQIDDQIAHLEGQKSEIEEALTELRSQRRALGGAEG